MSVLFLHHPKETDLALFAGGELGPLARWRIERHIQTCGDCEEAVADFFHLQGDVSELAELPPIDWAALSLDVREAVAEARSKPEPAKGGILQRPLVWQAGLASAAIFCAIVVTRQFSMQKETPSSAMVAMQQAEPAAEQAAGQPVEVTSDALSAASRERAIGRELAEQRKDADARALPASPGGVRRFNDAAPLVAPERVVADLALANKGAANEPKPLEGAQLARSLDAGLPGDVGARPTPGRPVGQNALMQPSASGAVASEPAAEKDEESRTMTLALARRDAPQPAPPAARKVAANERQTTAELFGGRASQQAQTDKGAGSALRAELKAATEAEALADRAEARESISSSAAAVSGGKLGQSVTPASGPGFSLPPGGLRMDTTVAADGGISYRSVDSRTGTITIYDVYAP